MAPRARHRAARRRPLGECRPILRPHLLQAKKRDRRSGPPPLARSAPRSAARLGPMAGDRYAEGGQGCIRQDRRKRGGGLHAAKPLGRADRKSNDGAPQRRSRAGKMLASLCPAPWPSWTAPSRPPVQIRVHRPASCCAAPARGPRFASAVFDPPLCLASPAKVFSTRVHRAGAAGGGSARKDRGLFERRSESRSKISINFGKPREDSPAAIPPRSPWLGHGRQY